MSDILNSSFQLPYSYFTWFQRINLGDGDHQDPVLQLCLNVVMVNAFAEMKLPNVTLAAYFAEEKRSALQVPANNFALRRQTSWFRCHMDGFFRHTGHVQLDREIVSGLI